ncbi:MAG: hypothetical protein ACTHOD_21495 [Motilibacteraceae bacterium]
MTSSEVLTATGIGKPSTMTSAGTMTKPPPTPKNPVSSPTTVAATSTLTARPASSRGAGLGVSRRTRSSVVAPPRPAGALVPGAGPASCSPT